MKTWHNKLASWVTIIAGVLSCIVSIITLYGVLNNDVQPGCANNFSFMQTYLLFWFSSNLIILIFGYAVLKLFMSHSPKEQKSRGKNAKH
jgi:ABC-type glycerol-3-phosphate transport system permease component